MTCTPQRPWRFVGPCFICIVMLRTTPGADDVTGNELTPVLEKAESRVNPGATPASHGYLVQPIWIAQVDSGLGTEKPLLVPAILRLPEFSARPKRAAVLIGEEPGLEAWRASLTEDLLSQGIAVLDLDVHTPRGVSADSGVNVPAPEAEDLLPDLFGAVRHLRRMGLGENSILGFGKATGGDAMVLAATPAQSMRFLGECTSPIIPSPVPNVVPIR